LHTGSNKVNNVCIKNKIKIYSYTPIFSAMVIVKGNVIPKFDVVKAVIVNTLSDNSSAAPPNILHLLKMVDNHL
jgi:hypothetical protein